MGRLSAGVVIVRQQPAGPQYLLLRAYAYWDFPKGGLQPGEGALAAAIREVTEETALEGLQFPWGTVFYETPPYRAGKVARYYLATAPASAVRLPVNPELGRPEHHEYRWLDYGAARRLLEPRVASVLDWAQGIVQRAGESVPGD